MALVEWFERKDIRPYVFVRPRNRPSVAGAKHSFEFPKDILLLDPNELRNVAFGDAILRLENRAFHKMGITMPRWAFYDCSVMPGMVVGFAIRSRAAPESIRRILSIPAELEWTPISLFIAIPSGEPRHWMAHNLCSINAIVPAEDQLHGLGFVSKAFGLWYSNIEYLYGVTQWTNPALKLHANFGPFEVVTAYTPLHDISTTVTYRVKVDVQNWKWFLDRGENWKPTFRPLGLTIDPTNEAEMIALQGRLEKGDGPFYLDGRVMVQHDLKSPIPLFSWT